MTRVIALLLPCILFGCEKTTPPAQHVTETAAPIVVAAGDPPTLPAGTRAKCPVTGEEFTVKPGSPSVVYKGKRYTFCCADCIPDFNKNPDKFAK
jgi:YHS domain-containing protein